MSEQISSIIIVGGGTAGWITAGVLAAKFKQTQTAIKITLIESSTVPTVGVGEGTWPTMRDTLRNIGISESDFIRHCDVSFKQGTLFKGWCNGKTNDHYQHPFSVPMGFADTNLVPYWQQLSTATNFATAVCPQAISSAHNKAPKQHNTPEFAFVENYGYHLDAGKFAPFLRQHCIEKLGVEHIIDDVIAVHNHANGHIRVLDTQQSGQLSAQIFVDCSGFSARLIGQHYQIKLQSVQQFLLVDKAIAIQVPYDDAQQEIPSYTQSTATSCGWIWDIGLQSRRGLGHVYSSQHQSSDAAEQQLRQYAANKCGADINQLSIKKLDIDAGYRTQMWHQNCVAIGLSAGFLEPLEAASLVLVELAASMLAEQCPQNIACMPIIAQRFNRLFNYRWQSIVDFLKLHYVLSERTEAFWLDNRQTHSIPESLQELLTLWQHHLPWHHDFQYKNEVFSAASYQYVLCGMGHYTHIGAVSQSAHISSLLTQKQQREHKLLALLPGNRQLLQQILTTNLPKK